MIGVIRDGDIFSEYLLAHPVVQARSLIRNRRRREVIKQKPRNIQHRRRLQDHRVAAGRQFLRVRRAMRLFAGSLGECLRIEVPHIRRIRLGPARRRRLLHRNREFRVRVAIRREQPARISHRRLRLPARENSRRHLSTLHGKIASPANRKRPIFRR